MTRIADCRTATDHVTTLNAVRTYWLSETAGVLDVSGPPSIECQRRIWWLADHFRCRAGVRDAVPGLNNLTVELDAAAPEIEDLLHALCAAWRTADAATIASRQIEVPVEYGGTAGPDLEEVARHTGLSPEEVIRLHSAAEYTVYFLGFLPGFPYLGGLDGRLSTPRRSEPRLTVPAGSVAIGGEQTGIYPSASPGGWQLIGRTSLALFDPEREPPSLLLPGDTVRFVNVADRP